MKIWIFKNKTLPKPFSCFFLFVDGLIPRSLTQQQECFTRDSGERNLFVSSQPWNSNVFGEEKRDIKVKQTNILFGCNCVGINLVLKLLFCLNVLISSTFQRLFRGRNIFHTVLLTVFLIGLGPCIEMFGFEKHFRAGFLIEILDYYIFRDVHLIFS